MTTTRPVGPDDVEAILELWHSNELDVLGHTDSTADDVRDALADPCLDPASWVVLGDGGGVLAQALVLHGEQDHADLDVVTRPDARSLLPGLLAGAVRLAAAGAAGRGQPAVRVDQTCYRADTALAGALRAAAFTPATSFHRMRRELDAPVAVRLAEGVRVERVDVEDDATLRRLHRLHQSTFAGHFGFESRPYEGWLESHHARSGHGPFWFATLDGEDAGFLHETAQFVEDEDAGYVWRLGVERHARGRGVAKALLTSSFAGMRDRGRRAVLLHVDTANATGATRLYESVGMRPVVVMDVWRATAPAAG